MRVASRPWLCPRRNASHRQSRCTVGPLYSFASCCPTAAIARQEAMFHVCVCVWSVCIRTARQAHREHRTFALLARHGHIATHHARELAREGKAKSRAAEVLSGRGIGLAELLEQLCLLLRGHADTGVGDGELDKAAAIARLACRKLDL